ncbi:hypothetical protein FIV53_00695 [Mycoplasma nasistruthionis]|uniref:UvrC family homology region profile domain-containing protein n=1 Tax=Mycoplasma nasistruthionis TaxID=353852 RepID=A0A4Y6I649_9MOLU|nr:hypothetical protein FIV53_00695 [Mycoplasma nasistruthionis]
MYLKILDNSFDTSGQKYYSGAVQCYSSNGLNDKLSKSFKNDQYLSFLDKKGDNMQMYATASQYLSFLKKNDFKLTANHVFIADGSLQQINQIKIALKEEGYNDVSVFGLVKNDMHKTEKLIDDQGNIIQIDASLKLMLFRMQEEIDKFAKNAMKFNKRKGTFKAS